MYEQVIPGLWWISKLNFEFRKNVLCPHMESRAIYWEVTNYELLYLHRENSPITQTTPEPTLLSWGGWPREKISPTPGHTASLVLSR